MTCAFLQKNSSENIKNVKKITDCRVILLGHAAEVGLEISTKLEVFIL